MGLNSRLRRACRDAFTQARLLERIIPDIQLALGITQPFDERDVVLDQVEMRPGSLWDAELGSVAGGVNYLGMGLEEETDTGVEE